MPKFTLTAEWDDEVKVTHELNLETLDDVVMQLDQFLRGCGYFYNGELGILYDKEDATVEDTFTTHINEMLDHNDYYYDTDRNR